MGDLFMPDLKQLYRETIDRVLQLEQRKKEVALCVVRQKNKVDRREPIYRFVKLEWEKQYLLYRLAVSASESCDEEVLGKIGYLYGLSEVGELLPRIKYHINVYQSMMEVLEKELKCPHSSDFLERRLLMEIDKQVMTQARQYLSH